MEMTDEERSGWRAFLIEHKIAQSFVQIEEKLVGEDALTQDRYDGPKVERYEFDELADLGLNVQYTTGRKRRSGMYFDDDGHEIFSDVPPIEEIWIECGGIILSGSFVADYGRALSRMESMFGIPRNSGSLTMSEGVPSTT